MTSIDVCCVDNEIHDDTRRKATATGFDTAEFFWCLVSWLLNLFLVLCSCAVPCCWYLIIFSDIVALANILNMYVIVFFFFNFMTKDKWRFSWLRLLVMLRFSWVSSYDLLVRAKFLFVFIIIISSVLFVRIHFFFHSRLFFLCFAVSWICFNFWIENCKMKTIITVFILTNLLYQHCFGYTEKRTFRERSKIHCSKLKINLVLFTFNGSSMSSSR